MRGCFVWAAEPITRLGLLKSRWKNLCLTTPHSSDHIAVPIEESAAETNQSRAKSCQLHVHTKQEYLK